MKLDHFQRLPLFRRFQYQRCWYLIRPCDDETLGIKARWIKAGISRTNLQRRLRAYNTYWPSGVEVLAAATIEQPEDSTAEMISIVEAYVLQQVRRIRPGIESLPCDQACVAIKAVQSHARVHAVWIDPELEIKCGLRDNEHNTHNEPV